VSTVAVDRPVPPLGGFSPAVVRLEVRRLLRNRRTLVFTMIAPVIFFLIFGLNKEDNPTSRFGRGNVSADILVSMALYGAVLATTSGGAMVSIERAAGWTRTLRVTPLSTAAYIAIKMVTALTLGASSVAAVNIVGVLTHKPSMPVWVWAVTAVCTWIGSLVFAAFGLFVGYLLPSENVMQIIGFAMMLFSFGGGLFIPLSLYSPTLRTLASFTPLWGLNGVVHYPLAAGAFDGMWLVNLFAWLLLFSSGAVWRFNKTTER
jgi:ABC-2 type transport system permease protein